MNFITLDQCYAYEVARLHIQGIKTGFISSLGIDFVTALYETIAQSKASFGFVAEENDSILGFVAFTTNLNKLYKSVNRLHKLQLRNRNTIPAKINMLLSQFNFTPLREVISKTIETTIRRMSIG